MRRLAEGLEPGVSIFRAQRIRGGQRAALGENGMSGLIERLLSRAGASGFAGHDLRRTFATLVRSSGADEFLTMRLLRDVIPGVGSRYISFPKEQLVDALKTYSPLTLVQGSPKATGGRGVQKQDGETDLPVHKKTKKTVVEAKTQIGGGGGESNYT